MTETLSPDHPVEWCANPDPVPDEPWVTDPECGTCGHKMSCCTSGYGDCVCNSDVEPDD